MHRCVSDFLSKMDILLLRSIARSLRFTILGEIFAYVTVFQSNHWGSHILSSWMVHAGCDFVTGIHPSRTRMSGSFESVRWNACVYRLDLGLYSHPKEFGGMWSHNPYLLQGKNPLYQENSPQRCIEPTTLHNARKRAQHTTELFWSPKWT